MTEYSISLYCMTEFNAFFKIRIVRSSALHPQNSHCTLEYNVYLSYQHYTISVVHFHAKHYTTEYNVSVKSA